MTKSKNSNALSGRDLLARLELPSGAPWIENTRNAAANRLLQTPLPHRRDEYWRFTDPAPLFSPSPAAKPAAYACDMFNGMDFLRLTFVDGCFDPRQSDSLDHIGISIETLATCAQTPDHWAQDIFGQLEARAQQPIARHLAALNTARAREGMIIHVTTGISQPILIDYKTQSDPGDGMIHHLIKMDENSQLTVLETGQVGHRSNIVLECDLAKGARLHHIRTQGGAATRLCATHIFAQLAAQAQFKSFTLAANGKTTRNEALIYFNGDDAHATIAGASIGAHKAFHHDDTVFVSHDGVNCESRQVFRKVLRNGATGVFQGKILVHPDAQKTDGYQISKALLLDEDSRFLAKPELEIYADDVVCSHGSTCGAIDPNALFYMTSRGIPRARAQAILIQAFLAEVVDEINDETIATRVLEHLPLWVDRV